MLTAPNFNLIPNKPPPGYGPDGSSSEGEDSSSDEEEQSDDEGGEHSTSLSSPQANRLPSTNGNGPSESGAGHEDADMSEDEDENDNDMMQVVDVPSLPSANLTGVGDKRPLDDGDDDDDYDA